MKRILLFTDSLNSGGAQRQFVGLARLLKEKGQEVKVVTYFDLPFYKQTLDDANINNVVVKGANVYWKRLPLICKAINSFKPDVVISYLNTPNIIACTLKMLGLIKCPIIVSERNTTQRLNSREKAKFFLMKWADRIIPNSYSQERFIKEHYPNLTNKVTTITNFVDTEFFCPAVNPKKDKDVKEIISVGRVAPQKNVKRFIEVVAELKKVRKDFHIRWYGKIIGDYGQECLRMTKQLGVNDVLEFLGDNNDIKSRYHESDIFVLPSIYEGFPNVLCEAMSCGLPVISSNVCDNGDIVEDGKNGIMFNPNDSNDMLRAFNSILDVPESQLKAMAIKSRKISISKFTSEKFVHDYIDIVNSLL